MTGMRWNVVIARQAGKINQKGNHLCNLAIRGISLQFEKNKEF
jgi:hypothetical protein